MSEPIMTDLDLEPIMVKVMDKEEGMGWSLDFTKRVALEYRKYLVLCKENPDSAVVPSSFVDDFWHFHILDTQKYQEDCERFFGYFLHHFPYFGMRGKEDEENLKSAWAESCALYKNRFGELPVDLWLASKRCPNCGRRCNNSNKFSMDQRPRLALAA
jgi:hypothetical protein